jgi:hypothetical protein
MPAPQRPPLYFGPVSSMDKRLRFVDLSQRFAPGDLPTGTPSAEVLSIAGDADPLGLEGPAAWSLGPLNVFTAPFGTPFLSPGPRIALTLSGGTAGNVYTIMVTWQDSQGQNVTEPVYQFVQWGPSG